MDKCRSVRIGNITVRAHALEQYYDRIGWNGDLGNRKHRIVLAQYILACLAEAIVLPHREEAIYAHVRTGVGYVVKDSTLGKQVITCYKLSENKLKRATAARL